ncbi:vitamin K epoxide reductase family protein [Microcella putealis]|uniref:vitamin K epoxide reductase family protein n=1 Tax=Microcella putealis TaxID=337005 RepID=UPI001F540B13|nr:vitamin K epoxide reductase family protein [Microcella putealis]
MSTARRPWAMAITLIITGAVGWWGAMALIVERVRSLADPAYEIACDVNPLLSCGNVMLSPQASLFGFPNPLLGVAGFVAPMAVGVALLAGARFDRWFWGMFVAGITGAFAFVVWLFTQSVFVIGVLCPYCLVVWAAVIPMFWATLLWAFGTGTLTRAGSGLQRRVARLMPFGWAFVVASYAAIALTILAAFPTLPASLGWL